MRIIPALDEAEDCELRFGLGPKPAPIEQLALKRGEEALGQGVVVGITDGPTRRADAHLLAALAKGERGVLAPVIGMVNDARVSAWPDPSGERPGTEQARA